MRLRPLPRAVTRVARFLPLTGRRVAGATAGWLALGLCAVPASVHAAPTQYSQGHPSDGEQYLLLRLNRTRRDPAAEGQRLAAWLRQTSEGQSVVAQYGTDPDQVAADFAALPPVPPLALNSDLLAAARSHSVDLAPHDGLGPNGDNHAGYDGSTPESRVYASGYRDSDGHDGYGGEDYDGGVATLDASHASFMVDWGPANTSFPHRLAAMNGLIGVGFVGIGLATKPTRVDAANPLVTTDDFGLIGLAPSSQGVQLEDAPAMLTGIVYADQNTNGQYDPGEGVAGVTVSMDGGAYYAVTTASGGFSLPLVNADGSNADGTVIVRTSALPGEAAGRTAVVPITRFATQYGSYRANVEWEVVPGQPAAGVAAGPPLATFFGGAAALGQDWYYLAFSSGSPFGYYSVAAYPFLFHDDLGWEYTQEAQDGQGGVYLYDFASASWWYTSPGFGFPYLYDFARHAVLYYYPASGQPGRYSSAPRYFYDFTARQIITL